MERAVVLCAVLLAGCASDPVTIPDTRPPFLMPPEAALQPCPTAEREGVGKGVVPDLADGSRGAVLRATATTARYLRTCDGRHRTLREHIEAYFEKQRPPQDRSGGD